MAYKILVLCIFFGLLQLLAAANDYETCKTPTNETSLCVELTECGSLDTLAQKGVQTREETIFLAQSQCAYKDEVVYVCCPPQEIKDSGSRNRLLPQAPECGTISSNRIIGESHTVVNEFPWMVLIEYLEPGNVRKVHCTGTLINNRYVLTAAQCLEGIPAGWRVNAVGLGDWRYGASVDCEKDSHGNKICVPTYITVGIEEKIVHPGYAGVLWSIKNDIGLLRLAENITLTEYIKPICLPFAASLRESSFVNRKLELVWMTIGNFVRVQLKTKVTVWTSERCQDKYMDQMKLKSTQMCAGGESDNDVCGEFAGGPLLSEEKIKSQSSYYLIGIESLHTIPCNLTIWPSVFTRVVDYLDWIADNVKA